MLATLTGQGNIIGNAENAVGKYNNSVAGEQQLLNEIEKYFIEHTNGGNGEDGDTNNPIVTATEGEEIIEEGADNEISKYFTYSANGTAEITSVKYTDTSNGDVEVENTNTLSIGTHIIKCTVTKETGLYSSATKTIIVEASEPLVPASDYGAYVTNYEVSEGGDPNVQWRIFYADEENVYLIASDYIHLDYAPESANNTLYDNGNGYRLSFNNVINDYNTGAANITDSRITKWINYVKDYPSAIGNGIKSVAFMLDEARWSEKYAKPEYAEYAIGGPTLELWCEAYKATHDRYVECSYNATGYQVKWSDSTSSPSYSIIGAEDDNDLYYIKSNTYKASYMWLASPPAIDSNALMYVRSTGIVSRGNYNFSDTGFRPLVCLQSGIQLEKQNDGTYLIK